MRVQVAYRVVAVLLSSSAYVFTGCSNHEQNEVGTQPQPATLERDDGHANAGDAGASTTANDDTTDGGTTHDASADDAGTHADAGESGDGMQCNSLARQPNDAPYYVRYGEPWPSYSTYSGGPIQDGTYELTEDRYYPAYPCTPEGCNWTGTSWTTLNVTGSLLSAVVTDHEGGEERFNATIQVDGSRIYLTPLCGLDSLNTKNEWKELKYPFIQSGYTATDDTLTISWAIGNHSAVKKVFQRVQGSQTTL